jgi:hypothetical protein
MKMLWILSVLLVVGCADPARNLYEGIKANNDAKRTPNEQAVSPAPSYDTYQKELEKMNK